MPDSCKWWRWLPILTCRHAWFAGRLEGNCSFQKPHTGSGGPPGCLPSLRLTLLPVRAPPALQPFCRASGMASGLGTDRAQPPALPMASHWPLWALPRATLHVGVGVSRVPVLRPCPCLSCTSTIQPWPACCPDGPPAPHPPWALVAPLLCRAGIGCRPRAPSGLSIFPARLSPAGGLRWKLRTRRKEATGSARVSVLPEVPDSPSSAALLLGTSLK